MRSVGELELLRKGLSKDLSEHPVLRVLLEETQKYLVNDVQRDLVGIRVEKHWDGTFTVTLLESCFTYAGARLRDLIPQALPGARVFGIRVAHTRKEYLRKTTAEVSVADCECAAASGAA